MTTDFVIPKTVSRHFFLILSAQKKPSETIDRINHYNKIKYDAAPLTEDELKALDMHAKSKYDRNLIFNVY